MRRIVATRIGCDELQCVDDAYVWGFHNVFLPLHTFSEMYIDVAHCLHCLFHAKKSLRIATIVYVADWQDVIVPEMIRISLKWWSDIIVSRCVWRCGYVRNKMACASCLLSVKHRRLLLTWRQCRSHRSRSTFVLMSTQNDTIIMIGLDICWIVWKDDAHSALHGGDWSSLTRYVASLVNVERASLPLDWK